MADEDQGELFKLSRTELWIEPGVTFNQWDDIGGRVREITDSSRWWRADWGHFGDIAFNEMAYQSSHINLSRAYKWTAEKFPPERRRADLSFSHHREVGALDVETQDKLLDMAAANNWTVQTLTAAVKETKAAGQASMPAPESRKFTEEPKEPEPEALGTKTPKAAPGGVAAREAQALFGEEPERPQLRVVGGTEGPGHDDLLLAVVVAAREAVAFSEITDSLRDAVRALDVYEEPLRAAG